MSIPEASSGPPITGIKLLGTTEYNIEKAIKLTKISARRRTDVLAKLILPDKNNATHTAGFPQAPYVKISNKITAKKWNIIPSMVLPSIPPTGKNSKYINKEHSSFKETSPRNLYICTYIYTYIYKEPSSFKEASPRTLDLGRTDDPPSIYIYIYIYT